MRKVPKVSIMIPTYNQEKYIEKSINSALAQNYNNIEIIISDDSSTDKTGDIAKKYTNLDNVFYYKNEKNIGRVANYRLLLYTYAKGDYVINLDGDDFFTDNNFIKNGISRILDNENDDNINLYVACKKSNVKNQSQFIHNIKEQYKTISGIDFVVKQFKEYHISHLTTIYNRKKALKCDFYRKNIISTDIESLYRLALEGDVIVSKDVVAQWNNTGENISLQTNFNNLVDNLKWINFVGMKLKENVPSRLFLKWQFRAKLVYSIPIYNSLKNNKELLLKKMMLLISSKMIIPLFVYSIYRCIKKPK
jgi:glycosyltransferase involved in cell wall biosynthesis